MPIAGSSLEAHLKRMSQKAGIPIEVINAKQVMVPKKADTLNSELAAAGVCGKSEQKQMTAWLGTRNYAAHGDYAKVIREVVALMVAGIRDFTVRYPA